MGRILEHWRVPAATLFSVALIIGAFVLARGITSPPVAEASAETALLKAIATKDSDNDGLPNWEEALYGTNPNNADSLHLGMTDGEAVTKGLIVPKAIADIKVATSSPDTSAIVGSSLPPAPADDTLTAAFAKNFITLYLSAKSANGGKELSESDISAISNEALNSFSSAIAAAPDFKTVEDLTVSGSGTDTLKAFAVSAEAVLLKNTSNATTSEINYLTSAVQNNDATTLPHIASIAKAYRNSAAGLAVLPVPKELATADLALINAMMRIGEITTDFTRVNDDPLATILALNQYPQAVLALRNAFINIGEIYANAGISLTKDTPGASLVNLISDMTAKQKS
ncbi:MAG: thrombospondin type 3 repeat-containing protein [Candidatus Kaiserbacteria bacterium]|nr:thrombospondin type 3 repeat-containing protein [Candidatus Kaiserbacteria bacterium]